MPSICCWQCPVQQVSNGCCFEPILVTHHDLPRSLPCSDSRSLLAIVSSLLLLASCSSSPPLSFSLIDIASERSFVPPSSGVVLCNKRFAAAPYSVSTAHPKAWHLPIQARPNRLRSTAQRYIDGWTVIIFRAPPTAPISHLSPTLATPLRPQQHLRRSCIHSLHPTFAPCRCRCAGSARSWPFSWLPPPSWLVPSHPSTLRSKL